MKKIILTLISTAAVLSMGLVQAEEYSGEFSVGAQYVITSFGQDDGISCDNGGTEYCGNILGLNSQLSLLKKLDNGMALYGDITFDGHDETNSNSSDRNADAKYLGIGVHAIMNANESDPWGVFLVHTNANNSNNADESKSGALSGLGIEKRRDNVFAQLGLLKISDRLSDNADGMESLAFIKAGTDKKLNSGQINLELTFGKGDFEDNTCCKETGIWTQFAVSFEAPLTDSGMNWYTGYQGDYVAVNGPPTERALFSAVQIGINMPFGEKETSPFKTPNLRAPITNAGEMN